MTATIIAFPAIRFTPADLDPINEVTTDYVRRGIWDRADRESDATGDRFLIWHPTRATPMFAITRTVHGYAVCIAADGGWTVVWRGDTIHDALKVWLERVRMPQPTPRFFSANA